MERLSPTLDAVALGRARALLKPPAPLNRTWPPVAAAGAAAASALALAVTVVIVPPVLSARERQVPHSAPSETLRMYQEHG
jgi:hypothetical protein